MKNNSKKGNYLSESLQWIVAYFLVEKESYGEEKSTRRNIEKY